MNLSINTRVQVLIDRLKLNPNAFAEDIGVAPPSVYNIVSGRKTKPSFDFLQKLKERFPQTDMNWLIAGVESPFITDVAKEPELDYQLKVSKIGNLKRVPIVSVKAAEAAMGAISSNNEIDVIDTIEVPQWMIKPGVHLGIQIKGLSMQPVLHDGCIVVARRIEKENWGKFNNNHIHVVCSESYGCQVKYLRRSERNPTFILMDSENYEENPSIGIHINEIHEIWEVDLSINFKFISQRRKIMEKIDSLEAAFAELNFEIERLKQK